MIGDGNAGSWKQPLGNGAILGNGTFVMAETKVVKPQEVRLSRKQETRRLEGLSMHMLK